MADKVGLVSVIVATYNWPEALALVLDSLALQTDKRFEVIVADDGSGAATAEMISLVAAEYPVHLRHVWQEDHGFRAASVRNLAVAASVGDYLLFLDGDCAVAADFVLNHICLAEKGFFVAGNRILLGESFTKEVFTESIQFYKWSFRQFLVARCRGAVNRVFPLIKMPDWRCRKISPKRWQGAKTCNLGIWRDDFYLVNGFDESFVGWGHEDAELVIRLIHAGISRKDGRFATAVMHLWHGDQSRAKEAQNMQRLLAHIANKTSRAANGVDKYK